MRASSIETKNRLVLDTFQNLLPIGIELDVVADNAKSHCDHSMESTKRSRRSLLSRATRSDRRVTFRFDTICEDFQAPTRGLQGNASFPAPSRRRPPMQTLSFDRWASLSDSEFSYVHKEEETSAVIAPREPILNNAQIPARKRSAEPDALSALIATMQESGEFDFDS